MAVAARILIVIVVALTAYEAALALRWFGGDDESAFLIALLALLLAFVVAFAAIVWPGRVPRDVAMLAPAAVAFMVARLLVFDAYYGPNDVRYVDHADISWLWVAFVAAAALFAVVLAARRPRLGAALAAVVVALAAGTSFIAGIGH